MRPSGNRSQLALTRLGVFLIGSVKHGGHAAFNCSFLANCPVFTHSLPTNEYGHLQSAALRPNIHAALRAGLQTFTTLRLRLRNAFRSGTKSGPTQAVCNGRPGRIGRNGFDHEDIVSGLIKFA